MNDAVPIPLKAGTQGMLGLRIASATRLGRLGRIRGKSQALTLFDLFPTD